MNKHATLLFFSDIDNVFIISYTLIIIHSDKSKIQNIKVSKLLLTDNNIIHKYKSKKWVNKKKAESNGKISHFNAEDIQH